VALLPVLGDALLACAESLIAAGRPDAAVPLCRRAARAPFPSHVRAAAVRIGGPAVGA
ncbi:MAG: tetratricopeptide repeat protein, partial [Verrucomicrobiales bacterium]|nr:tetratricopeptide repeat protein [Verrucomicrobiales bacterium]